MEENCRKKYLKSCTEKKLQHHKYIHTIRKSDSLSYTKKCLSVLYKSDSLSQTKSDSLSQTKSDSLSQTKIDSLSQTKSDCLRQKIYFFLPDSKLAVIQGQWSHKTDSEE